MEIGKPAEPGQEQYANMLSVVIPALNASRSLPRTLGSVMGADEIVLVDGGSTDGTAALAASLGARVLQAPRGRGSQLAAGVAAAQGDWLLLLHADTRLDAGWRTTADRHMATARGHAGYFRFRLDSDDPRARRLERTVAWRCRIFGLPYGDQGLLISRRLYDAAGGYAPIPLMEDVELARRLGRRRLAPIGATVTASARRYREGGYVARPLRNLACLGLYFAGVAPRRIARLYG